nr:TIGR03943 family protein [Nakamurella flavida]
MNSETQSIVVAMLGGLLVAITLSGRFTSYVKPGFAPLLLVGGGILVVVGLLSLVMAVRAESRAHRAGADPDHQNHGDHGIRHDGQAVGHPGAGGTDAHGHDHAHSRAPWLMLVPVLVLLLVAPPALGADSVSRTARSQALSGVDLVAADTPVSQRATMGGAAARANGGTAATGTGAAGGGMAFAPLPDGTNPDLGLQQVVLRALYDPTQQLATTPVTVTGFIAPAGDGFSGGWSIARMVINCCAADANPMQIHLEGTAPAPENTWVSAVVTTVPGTGSAANNYVPTVTLVSLTTVLQPADPYEH